MKGGEKKLKGKEVKEIGYIKNIKKRLLDQKGQSTLEYALVTVIAGVISAVLVAVGKPMIVDIIGKVFTKISSMV